MKNLILLITIILLSACGGESGNSIETEKPVTLEAKKRCLEEASLGTSLEKQNAKKEALLLDTVKLALKCNISESDMRELIDL